MATPAQEQGLPLLPGRAGLSTISVSVSENGGKQKSSKNDKKEEEGFGMWTGAAFTVNYIMGCGFLGIPHAFTASGLVLGPLVVLVFGFMMNITKDFMLETMGRAEALVHLRDRTAQQLATSSSSSSSSTKSSTITPPPQTDYLIASSRTFEVTDLFATFFSPRARTIYVTVLSGYMYGALWAYSTVFAASFSANVPVFFLNNGQTCNIEEDGSACFGPFLVWLSVFAVLAVPLSCLELKEQVGVQVLMFVARILVVLLMTGTVLAGYGCTDGIVFADMDTTDHTPNTPLFTFAGLSTIMPVSTYAFIFHHSVPVLSSPVKDKTSLPVVFRTAFIIVGVAYASLGLILAIWFGDHVDAQCNLNWRQYVGCVSVPKDGSEVSLADRSTGASIVSFIILIFPALDVLSAYPLNAITLGNNLLSACYGVQDKLDDEEEDNGEEEIQVGETEEEEEQEEEPAAAATKTSTTQLKRKKSSQGKKKKSSWVSWFASFRTMSKKAKRRVFFRLAAAIPPVIAGALSTLFGVNLTQILSFTGLIGVAIAFGIPSLLRSWSFTKHRAILQSIDEKIQHEVAAAAAEHHQSGGEHDESVVDRIIDETLRERIPKKLVYAGATRDDAVMAVTPYTNIVMKLFRADLCLFVFAIGIAIFVLIGLILNGGQ